MLTWISVFIVFSILILVHEAGHLVAAKRAGITVEVFSLGMGRRLFGYKIGGTDYRVSLFPFGGFCQMAGEDPHEAKGLEGEMASKPVGHRFWVLAAGPLTNYIFAFLLFSIIFMIGTPTLSNKINIVVADMPAADAGIIPGDRIMSINEQEILYWEDLLKAVNEEYDKAKMLNIKIERDGEIIYIELTPKVSSVQNIFGQKIERPMIGVGPMNEFSTVKYGPLLAFYHGGKRLLQLTGITYKMFWMLITGGMPVKGTVSGPIGIIHFIKQAANIGVVPLMLITAHISMALAIFNLMPILPLDGGHILFLFFEKLMGKPVNYKIREVITNIAVVLLLSFVAFVSWNDITRLINKGGS